MTDIIGDQKAWWIAGRASNRATIRIARSFLTRAGYNAGRLVPNLERTSTETACS